MGLRIDPGVQQRRIPQFRVPARNDGFPRSRASIVQPSLATEHPLRPGFPARCGGVGRVQRRCGHRCPRNRIGWPGTGAAHLLRWPLGSPDPVSIDRPFHVPDLRPIRVSSLACVPDNDPLSRIGIGGGPYTMVAARLGTCGKPRNPQSPGQIALRSKCARQYFAFFPSFFPLSEGAPESDRTLQGKRVEEITLDADFTYGFRGADLPFVGVGYPYLADR